MYDFNYADIVNYIKNNYDENWMTESQKYCYVRIKKLLEYNDVVNLYGQSGTGKTFLAWIFAKEGFNHHVDPESFLKTKVSDRPNVIIDKGPDMEIKAVRAITMPKAKKVIYISKKKSLPYAVELKLNLDDVIKIKRNLKLDNVDFGADTVNIWNILKRGYYHDNEQ